MRRRGTRNEAAGKEIRESGLDRRAKPTDKVRMPPRYRHELKYIISTFDHALIRDRMRQIATIDRNADDDGTYAVTSLYFDDCQSSAELETLDGVDDRSKYRVRTYHHEPEPMTVEIKEKLGHAVRKRSFGITPSEYGKLVRGDGAFLLRREEEAAREFYLQLAQRRLRPRVVIDYRREAYVLPYGNIRITFDRELSAWGNHRGDMTPDGLAGRLRRGAPARPALDNETLILEVKYDDYLPDHVRRALQLGGRTRVSVSKYLLCLDRQASSNKEGLWTD